MHRRLLVIAVVSFAFAAVGCANATMTVGSHVQRGLNFSQYRTYDWGPPDTLPTGDPRLERDPFFQDHLQGAVEKQLAKKGFLRPTSGIPDLLVHYHAASDPHFGVNRIDHTEVGYYDMGTFIVDIVDARTERLVWRGWIQEPVDDVLGHRDRLKETTGESITRMMEALLRRTP